MRDQEYTYTDGEGVEDARACREGVGVMQPALGGAGHEVGRSHALASLHGLDSSIAIRIGTCAGRGLSRGMWCMRE
jgi:hypothetical protein